MWHKSRFTVKPNIRKRIEVVITVSTRKIVILVIAYLPKTLDLLRLFAIRDAVNPKCISQFSRSFLIKPLDHKSHNFIRRVVRVVEGAALEMLCSRKEPRVRIPDSPPQALKIKYFQGHFSLLGKFITPQERFQ